MKKLLTTLAVLLVMAFAAKAQTQPINVVCDYSRSQYSANGNFYLVLTNIEYEFYFDIYLPSGQSDIVDGQTYTLADLRVDYSYGISFITYNYIDYSSVSLVRNNGSYVADVTDLNGQQYHITYTVAAPITEPTDTVTITMSNANYKNRAYDLISSINAIQLIGFSDADDYMLNVVFNTSTFAGSYSLADKYQDDQYFNITSIDPQGYGTVIKCNNLLEATVTGTASNCTAHIKWVAPDSTMYDITFAYSDPTVQTQQTFTATDLTINQNPNYAIYQMLYGTYAYDFRASDGTNILSGTVFNSNADDALGTWTFDEGQTLDFNLYDATTGEASSVPFNGTITIAQAQDGTFTLNGTSLFFGNTEWTFNCSYNVTPQDTIAILMDNAEVNSIIDYTSLIGQYQLQGADQNQEYFMLLVISSKQIAGSYTQNDVDFIYSGLIHSTATDTSIIDILSIADFTVSGNAKSCNTYVEILGTDHILYKITYTYTYAAPAPVDTVAITMDNEELNIVYDQTFAGMFQLIGADQNDEYRMQLVVYSEQFADTYTMSNVETFYSSLTHNTATDTTAIQIEDIRDFTVVGDATGCSTYIEILSTDLVLYQITYTYGNTPEPPVSVDDINATEFVITSEHNAIVIRTAEGEDIMVSDMAGRVIMNGKTSSEIERINVPMSGVYAVRIGNHTVNVLVK